MNASDAQYILFSSMTYGSKHQDIRKPFDSKNMFQLHNSQDNRFAYYMLMAVASCYSMQLFRLLTKQAVLFWQMDPEAGQARAAFPMYHSNNAQHD